MSASTLETVVTSDPEILGGTPVFAGTRVPIKNLVDYLAAGDPLERFLDHFPSVTRAQAIAVVVLVADSTVGQLDAVERLEPLAELSSSAARSRISAR